MRRARPHCAIRASRSAGASRRSGATPPAAARPDLWFTYHAYYKAPDWLGPEASTALGHSLRDRRGLARGEARRRPVGYRAPGRDGGDPARRPAALPDARRRGGAARDCRVTGRIESLPPFLDPAPFRAAAGRRDAERARLARSHGLDAVGALDRGRGDDAAGRQACLLPGARRALGPLRDLAWRLLIAGDGPARAEVEAALGAAIPGRAAYPGRIGPGRSRCALRGGGPLRLARGQRGLRDGDARSAGRRDCPWFPAPRAASPTWSSTAGPGCWRPAATTRRLLPWCGNLLVDAGKRARMGAAAAAFAAGERSVESAALRLGPAARPIFCDVGESPE